MPEPATFEEVASLLALASSEGRTVRARGGGTKLGWGHVAQGADAALDLRTTALDRIVEHNAGDLTAILEAGVTLSQAQETFAQAGQMLALDPPLSETAPECRVPGLSPGLSVPPVLTTLRTKPLPVSVPPLRSTALLAVVSPST